MQDGNGYCGHFVSPSRGRREFLDVISDIVNFITEDSVSKYRVVVGTDSNELIQANGHAGTANFVSVITVHRIGRHGRFFWKRISANSVWSIGSRNGCSWSWCCLYIRTYIQS